jgi:hypothetical protein
VNVTRKMKHFKRFFDPKFSDLCHLGLDRTLCIAFASTPNGSASLPPEIPLVTTEIPLVAVKILLVTTRHRDQWNKNPVGRDAAPSRARVYNMV